VEVTQVAEIEAAPGVDDIRKVAMPMPFNPPSPVLFQLMGVFHPDLVAIQAEVLRKLGSDHVLIVHADMGLDELSIVGDTRVAELQFAHIQQYSVTAQQFGFPSYTLHEVRDALHSDGLTQSAEKMRIALSNDMGPVRDIVAFNAAGALLVEEAGGRVTDYRGGPYSPFGREIVASNGALHPRLLDVITGLRR